MHEQIAGAFHNENCGSKPNRWGTYICTRQKGKGFSVHLFLKFDIVQDGPVDME